MKIYRVWRGMPNTASYFSHCPPYVGFFLLPQEEKRCAVLLVERQPPSSLRLSVRKVVPTLTSKSTKIGLLMAGAKQCRDTRFILVPAVGRTSNRGVFVALYCNAPWCS
jgi:hypothetical protein